MKNRFLLALAGRTLHDPAYHFSGPYTQPQYSPSLARLRSALRLDVTDSTWHIHHLLSAVRAYPWLAAFTQESKRTYDPRLRRSPAYTVEVTDPSSGETWVPLGGIPECPVLKVTVNPGATASDGSAVPSGEFILAGYNLGTPPVGSIRTLWKFAMTQPVTENGVTVGYKTADVSYNATSTPSGWEVSNPILQVNSFTTSSWLSVFIPELNAITSGSSAWGYFTPPAATEVPLNVTFPWTATTGSGSGTITVLKYMDAQRATLVPEAGACGVDWRPGTLPASFTRELVSIDGTKALFDGKTVAASKGPDNVLRVLWPEDSGIRGALQLGDIRVWPDAPGAADGIEPSIQYYYPDYFGVIRITAEPTVYPWAYTAELGATKEGYDVLKASGLLGHWRATNCPMAKTAFLAVAVAMGDKTLYPG